MSVSHRTKVLILGSGPAGYTAAIYAARANLSPILIAGAQPGGQLITTTDVENYPGFAQAIQGPWLMEQMQAQAEHVGTTLLHDSIVSANLSRAPFVCVGDSGDVYVGDTLIIATGAAARWLGLESEQHFRGFGVSACATCDGFFFCDKEVAIVGGGSSAIEEAIYLSDIAKKVVVIHRRNTFRAEKILQDRLFANDKVTVRWNSAVEEVLGRDQGTGVTGLRLRDTKTNALSEIAADGLFVSIGHDPNTALFKGQVEMDAEGYILTTPGSTRTSVPGVFAVGDVQDRIFRQAVTAAGTGCMGALEADRYLTHQGMVLSNVTT